MRFGIWQFAVNAAEKNRNIGAQLQSLTCIKAPKTFWKIYFRMTFGAHKIVYFKPFLDYLYELWQLLSALYSVMRTIFLYRCISTLLAINYCSGIFFNLSVFYTKRGTQTFPPVFWLFAILTAISRNLWCHLVTKIRIMYCLWKADAFWKKRWKPHQNRPINRHNTCSNHVPI